jgi:hypothetical protein
MKKTLLTICAAIALGTAAHAQTGYDFTYKTGQPYAPLTSGTNISAGMLWDDENWGIPMPFSFKIDGVPTSKFYIPANSAGPATDTMGTVNSFIPLGVADLLDRGTTTPLSPIRYAVEGTAPSRIFKVEYWNAGFLNPLDTVVSALPGDSVNFQMWVYETSDIIEFHYGDNHITAPSLVFFIGNGPLVGYARQIDDTGGIEKLYMLTGDPAAPDMDSTTDFTGATLLNEMPAKGTVYRFTPRSSGTSVSNPELLAKMKVYPTRTGSNLYISNNAGLKGEYSVYAMTGQQVINTTAMSSGQNELNVSQLPAAMYLLQVNTTEGRAIYRFIKE